MIEPVRTWSSPATPPNKVLHRRRCSPRVSTYPFNFRDLGKSLPPNAKIPPAAKEALNKSFSLGVSYSKSFTIWLRKGQGSAAAPTPHGSTTPTGHPPESPEDESGEQD